MTKQKMKSPEELKDDDERTNSMGLFNTAEAYWLSAMALEKANVKSGHADSPVRFLYYHALELYLKALLRQKHSVDLIREKFGHKTRRLVKEAEKLGLVADDEDRQVFSLMGDTDAVIEAVARKLRRTYVSRWTQLVTEAQSAGVLADEPDPRLLRDLILGALNAVSLAGQPSDDIAAALQALLGLVPGKRSERHGR